MSNNLAAVLDERRVETVSQDGALSVSADLARPALALYDSLGAIEPEWRQFEQAADCTPFQTFDWLAAWCRHVGHRTNIAPAIVVGRDADGELLFLLPLAVERGVARRLTWLGSDLCDYNAPLLGKRFSDRMQTVGFPTVWRAVRALLQSRPSHRHDLVALTKMPATIGAQANPFMTLSVTLNPSNAYATDLHESWEEYYRTKRSSATRRRDRTKLKRLGEFGEIRFVTPETRGDIARSLDTLMVQKARSFARMGVTNLFARPGWRDFFLDVATGPNTRHLVHVSRLDAGSIHAATNLGLTFRGCYYHVLASYDDGETSRFGPGAAHLRELLRYAIERGMHRFDFTIGDERYKREWSDATEPLYDYIAAATLRGWPAAAATHIACRLKRFIKQNEALWAVLSGARSSLGSRFGAGAKPDVRKSPPIAPD
jgi:CelD/BcsL family acetyltransferase involved in cellulose biosynthesis